MMVEEVDTVEVVADNRGLFDKVRVVIFLRGLRGWRGEMIREVGGQMRSYEFHDGGTGTSAETQDNWKIHRKSD
jgi:hypothetical protein